jgi:protoporphyrin/coproporphyrin ferrochelatase
MSAVNPVAQSYDAVLLIAFGGPTAPAEIRPFLARVTQGIPIPPARLEEVVHHYEAVGGKSPLNEITFRQAHALQQLLAERGTPIPVYVGMRNSAPFFVDTLEQMRDAGVRNALGFILSSHRTEASWERYQENIADARAEIGVDAPEIDYCGGWHDHPLFVQTWVELLQAAFSKVAPERRESTPLIFTAHSLPVAMAARSPYVEQLNTSAHLIVKKLGQKNWSLAYQSRSGKPSEPWLEPDINQRVRELAAAGIRDIVVAPIGFVCNHVEVLFDLDIEAKATADKLGVNLIRASCPNDHPAFIRMIASVIEARYELRMEDRG